MLIGIGTIAGVNFLSGSGALNTKMWYTRLPYRSAVAVDGC